ncbi:hypothetical protein BDV96DRAFT_583391 [Lophiotrema nucula]|uniref:Transcription initiation factor IIE subunit beta n=1 Tax=Lophiotrema nucula TaxID=690887 RepID=A0A6A5YTX1_9PLEO|nr:hypothetical protein BDV96DRAFT_583391 [Lophiotrema nucula]
MSLKPNTTARLSAPSPTPSNSSTGAAKRKRPADDNARSVVYSQPANTGAGKHLASQLTYTVEWLRQHPGWHTAEEIFAYLNIQPTDGTDVQATHRQLANLYQRPDVRPVQYNPKTKLYSYVSKLPIHNASDLMRVLQEQKSAAGISVKDLQDGWQDVRAGVEGLENEQKILVTHNKKDNSAKTVWINDKSLMYEMDDDFRVTWLSTPLPPNPEDLRTRLMNAGLKPSSAPRKTGPSQPKEKKKKAPRRGGKQTNTHMASILKDFSHMRK